MHSPLERAAPHPDAAATPTSAPPRRRRRASPPGHPEGFLEAFANVYLGVFEAIRARQEGRELGPLEGDFPTVEDGARGVRFIEAVVEASKRDAKWYEVPA